MKLALVSDLHLEFMDLDIVNDQNADVLILSGDILVARPLYDFPIDYAAQLEEPPRRMLQAVRFRNFLARCSAEFPHVIYVMGNHEFYHGRWNQTADILRDECEKFPNIHFLDKETWKLDDVTFIGGTLWTDMNRSDPLTIHTVTSVMSDYHVIKNEHRNYSPLRANDTISDHYAMLNMIRQTVDGKPGKYVVVGHHAPSKLSTHAKYADEHYMNGGYSSELSEFILDRTDIVLWTHGHTHHPFDYVIGKTRIVCNPRGYCGHERGSQEDDPYYPLVIEV